MVGERDVYAVPREREVRRDFDVDDVLHAQPPAAVLDAGDGESTFSGTEADSQDDEPAPRDSPVLTRQRARAHVV